MNKLMLAIAAAAPLLLSGCGAIDYYSGVVSGSWWKFEGGVISG